MRKNILLALVLSLAAIMLPSPAVAATPVIMVEEYMTGVQNTNLRRAVTFVDKYTKSRFKYGKCVYTSRCIIVKKDTGRSRATARASWKGSARKRVTLLVNPGRSDAYMARLYAHEIGHAMFLEHSNYRTNLMFPSLHTKSGSLVAFRFTDHQKSILRKR